MLKGLVSFNPATYARDISIRQFASIGLIA